MIPLAGARQRERYSTVTVLARLRGWLTSETAAASDLVGEQLQRDDREDRLQHPVDRGDRIEASACSDDLRVALG